MLVVHMKCIVAHCGSQALVSVRLQPVAQAFGVPARTARRCQRGTCSLQMCGWAALRAQLPKGLADLRAMHSCSAMGTQLCVSSLARLKDGGEELTGTSVAARDARRLVRVGVSTLPDVVVDAPVALGMAATLDRCCAWHNVPRRVAGHDAGGPCSTPASAWCQVIESYCIAMHGVAGVVGRLRGGVASVALAVGNDAGELARSIVVVRHGTRDQRSVLRRCQAMGSIGWPAGAMCRSVARVGVDSESIRQWNLVCGCNALHG